MATDHPENTLEARLAGFDEELLWQLIVRRGVHGSHDLSVVRSFGMANAIELARQYLAGEDNDFAVPRSQTALRFSAKKKQLKIE